MRISTCTNDIKTLYTEGNRTTSNQKVSVWLKANQLTGTDVRACECESGTVHVCVRVCVQSFMRVCDCLHLSSDARIHPERIKNEGKKRMFHNFKRKERTKLFRFDTSSGIRNNI